jgi:hypothetical protein
MRQYDNVVLIGITTNVSCGHVNWKGEQLSGCGKIGELDHFQYDLEGYNGDLWSSVSLCKQCSKKHLN